MKIDQNSAVTITFKLSETSNGAADMVIENATRPMAYLHGGYGNTLPKIEEALHGQEAGFSVTLNLAAADAFGEFDAGLVQTIAKKDFPPGVKVGGELEGLDDDGKRQVFRVVKIKGDTVHLDGNHPLAGKALRFDVKVVSVRAATPEEIAHKHVHGAGGHNH